MFLIRLKRQEDTTITKLSSNMKTWTIIYKKYRGRCKMEYDITESEVV